MSTGRLIGLAAALAAALSLAAFSYLRFDTHPSAPGGGLPPGDAANTPSASKYSNNELIDFWRSRVERDPRDYISFTELAGAFMRRARETGDVDSYTRAEQALRRALDLNPRYAGALAYEASLLFARHDFEGALNAAERIYSLDPDAAHALAVAGDARLELGRYSEAQSDYERLLELSRTAPVFSRLAHLRELQGHPDEAIALTTEAVAQADEEQATAESRAWYRAQLGRLHFNVGDLESARAQYEASIEAFPGYVHALAGLARVAAARGDYDEAIGSYEQVVARQPILEHVAALGDTYAAAGRDADAKRQYDLVAAIDGLYRANGINTDLEIALFLADHDRNIEDAVSQARTVYEAQPGSIRAADALSWALYKAGNLDEALTYSNEALRLGTQDPLLFFHAGMINSTLGNDEVAADHLARALEINPHFSVLHAGEAEATLEALRSSVRHSR